ncbi:MAG: hypothetical protein ACOYM3_17540 [Terrimicrobiaceae bacterium]
MHNPTTTESPFGELAGSPELEGGSAAQFENGLYDRAEVSLNLAAPAAPEIEDNAPIFDLTAEPISDEQEQPSVTADEDAATAPAGVSEAPVNPQHEVAGLALTIDPEFEALCTPPTAVELQLLQVAIKEHGQLSPLNYWANEGKNILLDGHNRHKILENLGMEVRAVEIRLKNRDEALDWVINNQLGRRNLNARAIKLLRGKLYNARKGRHGGARQASDQSEHSKSIAEEVGLQTGASPATVRRDAILATSVEKLKIEREIMSGSEKRSVKEIVNEAFPPEQEPVKRETDPIETPELNEYQKCSIYPVVQKALQILSGIPWRDLDPGIMELARADIGGALPPPTFHEFDANASSAAKKSVRVRRKRKNATIPGQEELPFMKNTAAEENAVNPAADEKELVPQL